MATATVGEAADGDFVFAITQVMQLMAEDPTWAGIARGLLVLAAIWWAWVGYAWLTNTIDPEEGVARLVVFAAMAAMLVVALAIPEAFGADALLFALAFAVVRAAQIGLYAYGSKEVSLRAGSARAPGRRALRTRRHHDGDGRAHRLRGDSHC